MSSNTITRVKVDKLFGLYSYDLPQEGEFSNATILYGDNGVGKSTLLRLVYHLLSPAGDRGHRTELRRVVFHFLEVQLSSGLTLTAEPNPENETDVLRLDIIKAGSVIARWDYVSEGRHRGSEHEYYQMIFDEGEGKVLSLKPKKVNKKSKVPSGESLYLRTLREHAPKLFILNADRKLDSDTVADPSDEVELRRLMHFDMPKSINQLVRRSREIGLTQALSAASKWISQKAISGTNQGSTNVHSVYVDVVKRLVSPLGNTETGSAEVSIEGLVERLKAIELKMRQHAEYELATDLSTEQFTEALEITDSEKSELAAALLQPYVKSLGRRLEAVEPIYEIIDDFVQTINGFLSDKRLDFKLGQGFRISNRFDTDLKAAQLSSGEQQLLLLFCYVITARDEPSVFMIDEPEISLNIKWQRRLVQSLLEITKGADIQFIFASHSMELLAQHRDRVVKLENSRNE